MADPGHCIGTRAEDEALHELAEQRRNRQEAERVVIEAVRIYVEERESLPLEGKSLDQSVEEAGCHLAQTYRQFRHKKEPSPPPSALCRRNRPYRAQ